MLIAATNASYDPKSNTHAIFANPAVSSCHSRPMQMYSACSLFQVRPLVTNNKDKPRAHFCAVPLDSLNDNTTSLIGDIILVVMCGVLVAQQGEPI